MESYAKVPTTKRFVVEDSITKVTSDGQPHELMTMIAGLSGVLAAIVILAAVVSLLTCKKSSNDHECEKCTSKTLQHSGSHITLAEGDEESGDSNRSSIATIYNGGADYPIDAAAVPPASLNSIPNIFTTTNHLRGNLNSAFMGSELNLSDGAGKKQKKRTHWNDKVEVHAITKETTIDMERY